MYVQMWPEICARTAGMHQYDLIYILLPSLDML